MSALVYNRLTVLARVLCPTGILEYQMAPFDFSMVLNRACHHIQLVDVAGYPGRIACYITLFFLSCNEVDLLDYSLRCFCINKARRTIFTLIETDESNDVANRYT